MDVGMDVRVSSPYFRTRVSTRHRHVHHRNFRPKFIGHGKL